MSFLPDIVWLNCSPALRRFDQPLLKYLAQERALVQWDYCQTIDEPNSLEVGLALLHHYLQSHTEPVHLVGHSTSGLLGLLYARQYPERVQSLTLLSVGFYPALDWQAHYYSQINLLRCSRYFLLSHIAHNLIDCHSLSQTQAMVKILEEDLLTSLSPHTLYQQLVILPKSVPVPLLVAAGEEDMVIAVSNLFEGWQQWCKSGDRLWLCPQGKYFFHYENPERVATQIQAFWRSLAQPQSREASPPFPTVVRPVGRP
jgi:pimeloyl-ACP methyl ester carboxylesterase